VKTAAAGTDMSGVCKTGPASAGPVTFTLKTTNMKTI
jgi:hypothetical protein